MLFGEKIKVRAIQEKDLASLLELMSDVVSKGDFLPIAITSEVELKSGFAENGFISDKSARYVMTTLMGDIVGAIWLFRSVPYFDAYEVGYQIFSESDRGKGYASEALVLVRDYIFEAKQVNRVEVRVAVGNISSETVAKKAGFILEGVSREAAYSRGKLHDMQLFAMLRREWETIRSPA